MTALGALFRLGFLSAWRRPSLRAFLALALAGTLLAPALAAFAFSQVGPLAVAGALGTACLFAPLAALFAGIAFTTGDRGGEGVAASLRASAGPAAALAAGSAGIAAACTLGTLACGAAALLAPDIAAGSFLAALLVASAAAFPAAATGAALGCAAPRTLATSLGALLAAAALAAPGLARAVGEDAPARFVLQSVPSSDTFLLARDAAFGPLPAAAAALSVAAAAVLGAAAVAAGTAILRGKDLAPGPPRSG